MNLLGRIYDKPKHSIFSYYEMYLRVFHGLLDGFHFVWHSNFLRGICNDL